MPRGRGHSCIAVRLTTGDEAHRLVLDPVPTTGGPGGSQPRQQTDSQSREYGDGRGGADKPSAANCTGTFALMALQDLR